MTVEKRQDRPRPTELKLSRDRRLFTVCFETGESFAMSSEFLRVNSPSAEVRGHGGGGSLPLNKQAVIIAEIVPVGNYAVRLVFDDGHNSGLYTWSWLHEIGRDQEKIWQDYLRKVESLNND